MSESQKQQALFYYGKGLNPSAIAKLLGVDFNDVDVYLSDFDDLIL